MLIQYAGASRHEARIHHSYDAGPGPPRCAGRNRLPAARAIKTQIYSIANTDLCLVATAEITLGGTLRDMILEESALPLRLAGISHCFRTEAGAHGKATRGIYRVHQFTKVELFAFTRPT